MKISGTCLWVLLVLAAIASSADVTEYKTYLAACTQKDKPFIALREFKHDGEPRLFLVDPSDLSTRVDAAGNYSCTAADWDVLQKQFADTPYVRALQEADHNADPVKDAGITHFLTRQRGVDVTIDLCPSRLPLDRNVFLAILGELGKEEMPVPLAISITGAWMNEHPRDLQWLLELQFQNRIAIDWINHTYHHYTSKSLPARENYILEKGTDVPAEILLTEEKMITEGMRPSVFFRFPGLVSDSSVFHEITRFGLIPVGSDAWLAKKQWPKEGSIILIHANGNDPIGVRDFLKLLREKRSDVLKKRWMFYDLRESVVEESQEEPR